MTRKFIAVAAMACLAGLLACEDDNPVVPPVDNGPTYRDLSTPSNVLYNLELACNKRDVGEYRKLLDGNFKFYLSAGDVAGGLPTQWGRTEEESIHAGFLDPNYTGPGPRCKYIAVAIARGESVTWTPIPMIGETWYGTSVHYDLQINVDPDITYISNPGSKVQFFVRNAGADNAPHWQLVAMSDLGSTGSAAATSSKVEPVTWGKVKAFYPRPFTNLTEKWHVLKNVELAYNERRIDAYTALLDADFTFFLSTGDVGGGLPESWGRATEVTANTHLFAHDPPGYPNCEAIRLNLHWDDPDGEPTISWVEIPAGTDEAWYIATVYYNFQIGVDPGITYISNPGSKAQFTVRNAGTSEAPHWQMVEMRDLGSQFLLAAATEQSTWGSVKALYR